jgi:hypothetical protein
MVHAIFCLSSVVDPRLVYRMGAQTSLGSILEGLAGTYDSLVSTAPVHVQGKSNGSYVSIEARLTVDSLEHHTPNLSSIY